MNSSEASPGVVGVPNSVGRMKNSVRQTLNSHAAGYAADFTRERFVHTDSRPYNGCFRVDGWTFQSAWERFSVPLRHCSCTLLAAGVRMRSMRIEGVCQCALTWGRHADGEYFGIGEIKRLPGVR